MVILCLSALALLCWPSRPALRRLVVTAAPPAGSLFDGASPRRGRSLFAGRLPGGRLLDGRWGPLLVVLPVGVAALTAGPAAGAAAVLMTTTVALLVAAELRRRRRGRQIGALLVATRTLAREVRTGSSPLAAVSATAAAHPACAAALEELAVAVVGRRGRGPVAGSGTPDEQADVVARLGDGWELSARHGVPWAALIDTVAADLADRQRADSVRNAQVAGPRVSGYVLAVMPALGILLGAGMGADPVHVLLHTGVGAVLLLVGSTLTCLGLAWTASIVRS